MEREREMLSNFKRKEHLRHDNKRARLGWETVDVNIQDLRFTQDTIKYRFKADAGLQGLHILSRVAHLLGTGEVHDALLAAVVQDGWYYSCNNRGLASLKIYANISRALMKRLQGVPYFTDKMKDLMQNKVFRVRGLRLVPYFTVRCVTRNFSEHTCSHPVECHETPADDGVLSPEPCDTIMVREMNATSRQISKALVRMFLVDDVFNPAYRIPLQRIPGDLQRTLVRLAQMFRR